MKSKAEIAGGKKAPKVIRLSPAQACLSLAPFAHFLGWGGRHGKGL